MSPAAHDPPSDAEWPPRADPDPDPDPDPGAAPAPPTATPQPLAPLQFPLHGSRLIEASAGTGKTFTIAMLYVRLVLGHGKPAEPLPANTGRQPDLFEPPAPAVSGEGFTRALTPPEILVVTFTEAATQELRDRIRARLTQAAGYFRAEQQPEGTPAQADDLLAALRADYPAQQWPAIAHRLALAADWMDEAAVSTIHSWCNRMLREHAFDSGSLFAQALETDPRALRAEVVRDYWRTFLASLDADAIAELPAGIASPADLESKLRDLLPQVALLPRAAAPAITIAKCRNTRQQRLAELKAPWHRWLDEVRDLIQTAREQRQFNARSLNQKTAHDWLNALAVWRDTPAALSTGLSATAQHRLSPTGLREIWLDGAPPTHPAFDALARLDAELAALPDADGDLLCHAAHWVVERFATEQARRAQMGFDDLLKRLSAALQGPSGPRLAEQIRRQFPVALIDEFQDTDPVQYAIFDAIYRIRANKPDTGLILIGDPKQAIYAFRGADIHTYLAARDATAGRHYTLSRNFRSTHAMVEAANQCFLPAESRPAGHGAFLFRQAHANPVPFFAARSQGRADQFLVANQAPAALTVWSLPAGPEGQPLGKGAYEAAMAAICASEIVRLLGFAKAGRAGFAALATAVDNRALVALRPADLAVLVDNRAQANAIRQALGARGVRSVYLSDHDSVFNSDQAADLQRWLAACAEPDDGHRLRAALATTTLGLDWAELDTLNRDEQAWETRVLQFRRYRDTWRRQGVLPMVRHLLNDFGVPARLLSAQTTNDSHTRSPGIAPISNGERILTDLLHLAELLQQASTLLEGEHALIRHLAEQRLEAQTGNGANRGDARQVRLESDADLVQVVTVHKSKGLEYPLVFVPFAASFKPTATDGRPLMWHEAGQARLSLKPQPAVIAQVERERLAEDLRKLYVALTRARYATWIGVAPLKDLHDSALGYLLAGNQPIAPADLPGRLQTWRGDCAAIALVADPQPTSQRHEASTPLTTPGTARLAQRSIDSHWWIASYTALTAGLEAARAAADTPQEETFREVHRASSEAATPPPDSPPSQGPTSPSTTTRPGAANAGTAFAVDAQGPLHDFPRGAEAGTFLHDLLEWAAAQGFARVSERPDVLRDQIARRCQVRGWTAWIDPLTRWLQHFLTTPLRLPAMGPLPASEFTLSQLLNPVAELEFWLSAQQVDVSQVDHLVREFTLGPAPRQPLPPRQLDGMLKGFIDLVFEHQGRFYVADYKSNWLGPDDGAYTAQAQCAAMLHSRYDVQYVLYLLALHRLLRSRLPDYDYDRHIGGAVYWFLRGTHAPEQGVYTDRPPRQLIESLDALFAAGRDRKSA